MKKEEVETGKKNSQPKTKILRARSPWFFPHIEFESHELTLYIAISMGECWKSKFVVIK